MALQSSPPLRLSEVATEFNGPMNLGAYLRNGAYVPDTPWNSGVPTAYPLRLLDLLGARADEATITAETYEDFAFALSPGTASANVSANFETDGQLFITRLSGSDGNGAADNWLRPLQSGIGSDYRIKATHTGGDSPNLGDNTGEWYRLDTVRGWGVAVSNSSVGTASRSTDLLIEIQTYDTRESMGSGTITLTATATVEN